MGQPTPRPPLALIPGFSSSAAVTVLVARAFNRVYDLKLTVRGEMELAYLGEIQPRALPSPPPPKSTALCPPPRVNWALAPGLFPVASHQGPASAVKAGRSYPSLH